MRSSPSLRIMCDLSLVGFDVASNFLKPLQSRSHVGSISSDPAPVVFVFVL